MKRRILKGRVMVGLLAATLMICPMFAKKAKSEEKVQLKVFSAPSRFSNYALAFGLTEMLRKYHPYIRMSNIETKGSVEIIRHMRNPENKKNALFFQEYGTAFLAIRGTGPYKGKEPLPDMVTAITIAPSTTHLFVSEGIKKPQDLVDKVIGRVATAPALSVATGAMIKVWNLSGRVRVVDGSPKSLVDALNDGKIHASFVPSAIPVGGNKLAWNPLSTEALAGRNCHVYPLTKEDIEAIVAEGELGWTPAKWLTPGFTEPQWTISGDMAWLASTKMDNKLVYEIVKTALEHSSEFGEYHATGRGMTKERLAFSFFLTEEGFHPGAVKAYKEMGIEVGKR